MGLISWDYCFKYDQDLGDRDNKKSLIGNQDPNGFNNLLVQM